MLFKIKFPSICGLISKIHQASQAMRKTGMGEPKLLDSHLGISVILTMFEISLGHDSVLVNTLK